MVQFSISALQSVADVHGLQNTEIERKTNTTCLTISSQVIGSVKETRSDKEDERIRGTVWSGR